MEDVDAIKNDMSQLVRLSLLEQADDVRLYVARLVRKYRKKNPEFAAELDQYLKDISVKKTNSFRKTTISKGESDFLPVDDETKLSLLKVFKDDSSFNKPLFPVFLDSIFELLIKEQSEVSKLSEYGLEPTRSAIFTGAPGVGKTLTARWLASQLQLPLFVLDLTAVMSSLLGKSGSNLRSVLDFAKTTPCVLLLDEFDAIAKRRSDETDIGELKRLVTVILQEVDEWTSEGLLLAATNHPELIDPALWRRFDLVVKYPEPDDAEIKKAVKHFIGKEEKRLNKWIDVLTFSFKGYSYSDIEKTLNRIRRKITIEKTSIKSVIEEYIKTRSFELNKKQQIELSKLLTNKTQLSQRTISEVTGVSRTTIRNHT